MEANDIAVEVVTVDGANHEDIVRPATQAGQATLQAKVDLITNTRCLPV